MKLLSALALGSSLFCAASARPSGDEKLEERRLKTASFFAVTGVHSGGVQPRLEIRTLQQNADQWNIFLLSLANFQSMSQSDNLSYYGVAGVHGVPNFEWDGVPASQIALQEGAVGYCPHSAIIFMPWHRAYMATFEMAFYSAVQSTVASFPSSQQARWQAAATNLRWPYWDWAMDPPSGQNNVPSSITNPYVSVTAPSGQVTINNPLLGYTFNPLDSADFLYYPWDQFPQTLRYPNSEQSNAVSSEYAMIQTTNNNRLSYQQRMYNLFTAMNNYTEFGTEAWEANSQASYKDSLEAVHDAIHGDVGGYNDGHMAWLYWAAFDPIFWLHHANVDRMGALWQAIYPDSWLEPFASAMPSYYYPNQTVQNATSFLAPFHKNAYGHKLSANNVRDWTVLGYTYPEFVDSDGSPSAIMAAVNNLYGPAAQQASKREVPIGTAHTTVPIQAITAPNGNRYEYIVNVVVNRMALNGTFAVLMFFGTPPSSPSEWPAAPNMVGSHSIFSSPMKSGSKMGDARVSGTVPLNNALINNIANGKLSTLSPANAVPFLQKQLQWRVLQHGQGIDPSDVSQLEISVVSAELTPPPNESSFPTWHSYTTHVAATHGKKGGLSDPNSPSTESTNSCSVSVKRSVGNYVW